jgi:hypothetical protein
MPFYSFFSAPGNMKAARKQVLVEASVKGVRPFLAGFVASGVLIKSGTFTMSGGEVSGNNAANGGGVALWENTNATFNMSGGVIRNNTIIFDGGSLLVMTATTFNMTGGEVTLNQANVGGGLYLKNGNLTGNPSIGSKDSIR